MENEEFREHPLDFLIDGESESDFGEIVIRDRFDHGADENASGKLGDWSAQDFASIYVRFKPHLERHAKRYLSNPIQAEEIVQDSFLYLMTTLPEIDSELGVLKFLKWKIRLLCFDVLRSASHQREASVPEFVEHASDDPEFTADLERAEDNAVIRLALARLNPRQREALVASVYEDKTSEQVAEQLGLSPNATRQLLFRARSAFRKALVGEAEIHGKSISQVLTIAAKKAALDAKENATKVGAFLVLAAVGVGILPSLIPSTETVVAEAPVIQAPNLTEQTTPAPVEESKPSIGPTGEGARVEATELAENQPVGQTEEFIENSVTAVSAPQAAEPVTVIPSDQILNNQTLSTILATNVTNAGFYTDSYSGLFGDLFQGVSVEIFGGTGISAFLDLNVESKIVHQIIFQMWVDGERYFGVARSTDTETLEDGNGYTIAVVSKEFYVVDEQRNVSSDSPLANSKAVVTLELAEDGTPVSASMKVESIR